MKTLASDWYAVGVMLYEALTGQPPFQGSHVELLVKKQTEDAPLLTGQPNLPQDLARLIDGLLQRDPDQRLGVESIREALGITSLESISHDPTPAENSEYVFNDKVLVGREKQLEVLLEAFLQMTSRHHPVATFVSGLSGEGKSSLVENFLSGLKSKYDVVLFAGRCYDRESVPFKAIDTLIDSLVDYLQRLSDQKLQDLLPEDVVMLAQIFPVLRRVGVVANMGAEQIGGLDFRQIRYRAFAALAALLKKICLTQPVVLFIDDLQWGDADSACALFQLISDEDPPPLLFLGSFRSDEAEQSPFLREWRFLIQQDGATLNFNEINVGPLSSEQCLRLMETQLGKNVDHLQDQADRLVNETGGNPYLLEQLMQCIDPQTGRLEAKSYQEVIASRFQRLPPEATKLLNAIAIAGQAVSINEVEQVSGCGESSFSTITHMRSEQLVRFVGSDERSIVDTYHDKVRESVLANLSETAQTDLHLKFATHLEQEESLKADDLIWLLEQDASIPTDLPSLSDRVFDIAYHFHAANHRDAFVYQLMAGELSFRAYASEDAVASLKRAESLLRSDASPNIKYRLYERLGTANFRLKNFDSALEAYENALNVAPSPLAGATVHSGISLVYQMQSEYTDARKHSELALRHLGRKIPNTFAAIFSISWMSVYILSARRKSNLNHQDDDPKQALEHRTLTNLTYMIPEQPNALVAFLFGAFRIGYLAIRSPDDGRFAYGMSTFGAYLGVLGAPRLAARLLRRIEMIGEDVGNTEVQGKRLAGSAMIYVTSMRLNDGDNTFVKAIPLLTKAGSHWQILMALHLRRHLLFVIGESSQEIECANEVLRFATEVGDLRGQCWGNYDVANGLARAGNIESALERIERAREILNSKTMSNAESIFQATEGYVLLQNSQYSKAAIACELSWKACKKNWILAEYNARFLPELLESLAGPNWNEPCKPATKKAINKWLRFAPQFAWLFPILKAPILRAQGRAFATLGKTRKAIRYFERALKTANEVSANYDKARALLDLAAVKEADREKNRQKAVELLKQTESSIPYAERWQLGANLDESCYVRNINPEAFE